MQPNGEPPQNPPPWQPPPVPDGAQSSPSQQPDGAVVYPPVGYPQQGYPQGYSQAGPAEYPQSAPPAPQSGMPYQQSAPPVQHSVPPFTPPPQSSPPYAQPSPPYGQPGPQFAPPPGPQQFGQPRFGQPGPGYGAPKKGPNPALIILLAIVAAAVVLPIGFFGIRYATMESGPYLARPDLCDAMDGEVFTRLMADTKGTDGYGDAETPQCTWDRGEGATQSHLSMLAMFGSKHWLQGDSLSDARETYQFSIRDETVPAGRIGARTDIEGVGDEGRCTAETTDRVNVTFGCVLRDANLVLSLDVTGPYVAPETLPDAARVDEAALKTALDAFWSEAGAKLMEDYLEELR